MLPNLSEVKWIELPTRKDHRGTLTIASPPEILFSVARLFYLHGIAPGVARGGHAHRVTAQIIIPVSGRFMLDLTDGMERSSYTLDNPQRAIYVPPMIWDHLYDFTPDSVCLVLASTQYSEPDYIRDWNEFLAVRLESNQ